MPFFSWSCFRSENTIRIAPDAHVKDLVISNPAVKLVDSWEKVSKIGLALGTGVLLAAILAPLILHASVNAVLALSLLGTACVIYSIFTFHETTIVNSVGG